MSWGKGITIALISFMSFIIVLVVILMSNSVELETEDYYQREMAYETEIQAINNANNLDRKIDITTENDFVIVHIPEGNFEEVQIELFRPNDKTQDKIFDVVGTNTFMIPTGDLVHGHYNVSISYKENGIVCLQKDKIFIQ